MALPGLRSQGTHGAHGGEKRLGGLVGPTLPLPLGAERCAHEPDHIEVQVRRGALDVDRAAGHVLAREPRPLKLAVHHICEQVAWFHVVGQPCPACRIDVAREDGVGLGDTGTGRGCRRTLLS
jgi:hypothetical protein